MGLHGDLSGKDRFLAIRPPNVYDLCYISLFYNTLRFTIKSYLSKICKLKLHVNDDSLLKRASSRVFFKHND